MELKAAQIFHEEWCAVLKSGITNPGLAESCLENVFGEIYKITLKTKCINTIHENIHGREVLRSSFICKRLKWMQNVFFGKELMFQCPNWPKYSNFTH